MTPTRDVPDPQAGGLAAVSPAAVTMIGPYRIEREIARGGMGIVYLARDTRLDRAAAIKALPDDVASDPERLARFEREARLLASLNHPNIAGIYGLEESGGRRYLALEHVEGETLAHRLAAGPLPIYEAVDLCIQVASGIEAAHEAGVVHRDLKPGNVMITAGDVVKVVDFGLAKGRVAHDAAGDSPTLASSPTFPPSPAYPVSPAILQSPVVPQSPTIAQSPTLAHSPTIGVSATLPGVILGTAGYLSPEQARGKPVDRRTDIWSFGCVLYECLTGRLAYDGETVSDTIAKILEREVDWSLLPAKTPPRVTELLRRCLEKDPRKRLRDIGDARLALEEVKAGAAAVQVRPAAAAASRPAGTVPLWIAAAAILGLIVGGLAGRWTGGGGDRGSSEVTRLSVALPNNLRPTRALLTPDGRTLVVLGRDKNAKEDNAGSQIFVRPLDRSTFEPLAGTQRAQGFTLSRDGKWVAFLAPVSERTTDNRLMKMPLDGSAPPVPIAKAGFDWDGNGSWLASGDILIPVAQGTRYVRVPTSGGEPSEPKAFGLQGAEGGFNFGEPLPGDRGVLASITTYEKGIFRISCAVLDLKTGKAKVLVRDAGTPRYSPTGHLLLTRSDALLAAPFDLGRLEVTGEPVAILGGLRVPNIWAHANYQIAGDGTLLYTLGGNVAKDRHAVMVDAEGRISEWSGERQPFEAWISVSPDGNRLAGIIANAGAIYEIWVSERGHPASRRVAAVEGADLNAPTWSPDGSRLAFTRSSRSREDGIYVVDVEGGAPRRILRTAPDSMLIATSWSREGDLLLVRVAGGDPALFRISTSGPESQSPMPILPGPARRAAAVFSPDGKLIAYISDESGRFETYVSAWEGGRPSGQPLLVSAGSSGVPRWGPGGNRLYYPTAQNKMMSVSIQRAPRLAASAPVPIWDFDALRLVPSLATVLPDGRLLAIQRGEGEDDITRYEVALHFDKELRAKMRGR